MSPDRLLTWVPRIFLAVGLALLPVAAVLFVLTLRFVSEAERTTGTVVALSRDTDSEGSVTFYPIVRFSVDGGRTIEFRSSSGSSSPPQPGETVDVLYDPDDPGDARLAGFLDLWLAPIGTGLVGSGFVAVALVVMRRTRGMSKTDAEWLRRHGRRMRGASPRVIRSDDIDVAGSSPFRVEVDVGDPAGNEVRVLSSENVCFDPSPYLEGRDALVVWVDPQRPDRYLVDLSFLPRLASDERPGVTAS